MPDTYRATIGRHKSTDSPVRPRLRDPAQRRFHEGWAEAAVMIKSDTAAWPLEAEHVADGFRWVFQFAGHRYALTDGAAAAICDAWAFGTWRYAVDGYTVQPTRVRLLSDALVGMVTSTDGGVAVLA